MPGSVVLNTAIGMLFIFLTASLICSAAIEWVSNRLNKRGEYLLRGLREMLDIPPVTPKAQTTQGTAGVAMKEDLTGKGRRRTALQNLSAEGVALRVALSRPGEGEVEPRAFLADLVLAHPIIAALHRPIRPGRPPQAPRPTAPPATGKPGAGTRRATTWGERDALGDRMYLASYVSAQAFTRSLIDLVVPNGAGRTTITELEDRVRRLPDTVPAKEALLALLRDASDSVDTFRRDVERWYDEQMGRVSGRAASVSPKPAPAAWLELRPGRHGLPSGE